MKQIPHDAPWSRRHHCAVSAHVYAAPTDVARIAAAARVRSNAAVARAVVDVYRRYADRSSMKGLAFFRANVVVVILQDVMTAAERTLIDRGKPEAAVAVRRRLQTAMRPELAAAVTAATGCDVDAATSDVHVDSDTAAELFVLRGPHRSGVRGEGTPVGDHQRRAVLDDAVRALGLPRETVDDGGVLRDVGVRAGFIVTAGHLAGRLKLGCGHSTEIVGPGDAVVAADPDELPTEARLDWTGVGHAEVAWMDHRMWGALLRDPPSAATLIASQARRAESARAMQSVMTLVRVDQRIQCALWLLAERFGRVIPAGTLVGPPLSHRLIGELVGARRPSVTTAVTKLTATGRVSRDAGGRWLLHGMGPELSADPQR
jgi:CRP/FNR family cyclic AMP-dependent transcriptional regulator